MAGEFETGLDKGGQTREHARLLRSVGVYELIVACNKMDDGGWSQQRYDEIVATMRTFLATCGYKVDKKVTFVPTSGGLLCDVYSVPHVHVYEFTEKLLSSARPHWCKSEAACPGDRRRGSELVHRTNAPPGTRQPCHKSADRWAWFGSGVGGRAAAALCD